MSDGSRFDRQYYDRYYRNPRTMVHAGAEIEQLGSFVAAYIKQLGQPVRRVLDIGCGLGFWKPVVADHFPGASYTGVEYSEHLCEELGWEQGSLADYRARKPFDFVICQGVLQYMKRADADAGIRNLAQLCSGVLYLEALTSEDWRDNCDQKRSDGDVHLRSAAWYRRRLAEGFTNCGGGVYLSRRSDIVVWELDKCSR